MLASRNRVLEWRCSANRLGTITAGAFDYRSHGRVAGHVRHPLIPTLPLNGMTGLEAY